MIHLLLTRPILKFPALLLGVFTLAAAQPVYAQAEKKDSGPQLIIVCATTLSEGQEVVLASRNEKGDWSEHGDLKLRSSLITELLPVPAGELHLALRGAAGLESICQFTYPSESKRAISILVADPEKKVYSAHVIDPEKMKFIKGTLLISNFSPHTSLVSLGSEEKRVEAGQHLVSKLTPEANGMYRMLVSFLDAKGKAVSCYDRQASGNDNSRDMLFLLPDKILGIKVLTLPMFGSLD